MMKLKLMNTCLAAIVAGVCFLSVDANADNVTDGGRSSGGANAAVRQGNATKTSEPCKQYQTECSVFANESSCKAAFGGNVCTWWHKYNMANPMCQAIDATGLPCGDTVSGAESLDTCGIANCAVCDGETKCSRCSVGYVLSEDSTNCIASSSSNFTELDGKPGYVVTRKIIELKVDQRSCDAGDVACFTGCEIGRKYNTETHLCMGEKDSDFAYVRPKNSNTSLLVNIGLRKSIPRNGSYNEAKNAGSSSDITGDDLVGLKDVLFEAYGLRCFAVKDGVYLVSEGGVTGINAQIDYERKCTPPDTFIDKVD